MDQDIDVEDIIKSLNIDPATLETLKGCVTAAFNESDKNVIREAAKVNLQCTKKAIAIINNKMKRAAGSDLPDQEAQVVFLLIAQKSQDIQMQVLENE